MPSPSRVVSRSDRSDLLVRGSRRDGRAWWSVVIRTSFIAAPIRATIVKSAYEPGPVTTCCRRAGLTVLLDLPRSCPGLAVVRAESSWSARSRAAARTNELDAGKRRKIVESEEGSFRGWLVGVACWFPELGWRSGLTSTHPAPRQRAGGCHDHVSGDRAAQSNDRARRWRRLMPQRRAHPGLGDPPVFTAAAAARSCWRLACRRAGGRRGSAACGRSRWWRSSSRGVSRCRRS